MKDATIREVRHALLVVILPPLQFIAWALQKVAGRLRVRTTR